MQTSDRVGITQLQGLYKECLQLVHVSFELHLLNIKFILGFAPQELKLKTQENKECCENVCMHPARDQDRV